MGLFHCPFGNPYYDSDGCIDCAMCLATTKEQMIEASKRVREYLKSHQKNSRGVRKIAVCGKGGTGKSTIVTLLADALRLEGWTVLVIDTDESNPGLFRLCGFAKAPEPLMTLLNGLSSGQAAPETEWLRRNRIHIEDIPSEYLVDREGLKFLMVGKIEDPFQGCACSMADGARDLVEKLVTRDRELLLIDMEAGVENFGRGVERSVDTVVVIVEPSFESRAVAEKIRYMSEGMGISRVRVILNKVPSAEIGKRMSDEWTRGKADILGTVCFDAQVSEDGFEGRALGDSRARDAVRGIAKTLMEETHEPIPPQASGEG
jgi:CO dehydrogenase maturation factor